MKRVVGKVAIVTGGGQGLGEIISSQLAKEGAKVSIWDINESKAWQVAEKMKEENHSVQVVKVDVSKYEEVNMAATDVIEKYGRVDVLINNAGIVSSQRTILDLRPEQWDREIAVNLTGIYYCTRAVLNQMIKQKSGKIINISSQAGECGRPFTSAAYAASKAGVLGFTMSVARSVANYGINVNAVCPGFIRSKIHDSYSDEQLETLQADIPLNRHGEEGMHGKPIDVANAVLFFASNESDYITGTRIRVNGGSLMG